MECHAPIKELLCSLCEPWLSAEPVEPPVSCCLMPERLAWAGST